MYKVVTGISHFHIVEDLKDAKEVQKHEKERYPNQEVVIFEKFKNEWFEVTD